MSTEFKIDKGVPMSHGGRGQPRKYQWAEMEIGDSVFLQTQSHASIKWARQRGYITTQQFTTRSVVENGVTGVRVWRVS